MDRMVKDKRIEMIKEYFVRKGNTKHLGLSWEDQHPIDYLFGPSKEDIEWLKEKIAKDERDIARR